MADTEIKTRDQIKKEDKWDLSSLFASEADWEKALADMNSTIPALSRFKGTLGQSAEKLAECGADILINSPDELIDIFGGSHV